MNCSSAEALFERFLDGDLTHAERSGVTAHVDRCAHCADILEELRVVDALLLEPRRIELRPNFTVATMAEARALPAPMPPRPLLRAYLVSYVAAAWMLAGAALIIAPQLIGAIVATTLAIARSSAGAIGGFGEVLSHALGHGGATIGALLAALLALDLTVIVAFGTVLRYTRPQALERLRS